MAYAETSRELEAIETNPVLVTEALEAASGLMDSRYLVLYVTPVDFDELDAGDEKTRLQARFTRWCRVIAANYLTANRPGQSEQVVAQYTQAITELDRVRAGFERLPLLTPLEAPVRARAW